MAKKKVHTSHHMEKKWHKNGIMKPKTYAKMPMKGVYIKHVLNSRFARKHDPKQNKRIKPKK